MTDFSKIRIPFALALLAAMFAVNPLIDRYGDISYLIVGLPISISFIYLLFCSLLGGSVYFYAIGLVGEKAIFALANKLGNITYALALIAPPLFLILYPVSLIVAVVVGFTQSPAFSKSIEYVLSAVVGVTATLLSRFIINTFSQRDKAEKVEKLSDQENQLLTRAKELYTQGYYDLAVTESWKALEIALRKSFISIGEKRLPRTMHSLIELARQRNLMKDNQANEVKAISTIRNEAVHTERHINKDEALRALRLSEKLTASFEGASDSCYFCRKMFRITDLDNDDCTGASVCAECAKKNPDWKAELMAMGMDP